MKNPNQIYIDRLLKARKHINSVRDDVTDALHNLDNAVKKLKRGKKIKEKKKEAICLHCKEPISIRNPKGFCDHLYYPDNCKICTKLKKQMEKYQKKAQKAMRQIMSSKEERKDSDKSILS